MTSLYQLWCQEETAGVPARIHLRNRGLSDDIKVVYRISQLIGVAMDDRIDKLPGADVSKLRRVTKQDLKEVQWTRRTLHKLVQGVGWICAIQGWPDFRPAITIQVWPDFNGPEIIGSSNTD